MRTRLPFDCKQKNYKANLDKANKPVNQIMNEKCPVKDKYKNHETQFPSTLKIQNIIERKIVITIKKFGSTFWF